MTRLVAFRICCRGDVTRLDKLTWLGFSRLVIALQPQPAAGVVDGFDYRFRSFNTGATPMLLSVFPNQRGWAWAGCGPGLVGPRRVGPHEALDQMRATEPLLALAEKGLGWLSARDWNLPPFSQSQCDE